MRCALPKHRIFNIERTCKDYEMLVRCDCGEKEFMVEWYTGWPVGWDADQWQRVCKSLFLALNEPVKTESLFCVTCLHTRDTHEMHNFNHTFKPRDA